MRLLVIDGNSIANRAFFGIKLLTLPVGGFLTLGALIAAIQWALAKSEKKKEAK